MNELCISCCECAAAAVMQYCGKYVGITAAGQISQLSKDYTGSLMGQSVDAGSMHKHCDPCCLNEGLQIICCFLKKRVLNPRSGATIFFRGV